MERCISYINFKTTKNWANFMPKQNWCLLINATVENKDYFSEIITESINRNVVYICAAGICHNTIHEMADDEIVLREVMSKYLPSHHIITTGDEKLEEALRFAIYTANHPDVIINSIIIIDLNNSKDIIDSLIKKLESK